MQFYQYIIFFQVLLTSNVLWRYTRKTFSYSTYEKCPPSDLIVKASLSKKSAKIYASSITHLKVSTKKLYKLNFKNVISAVLQMLIFQRK